MKKTKIIAHRGARSIAPENTIIAAEIARVTGADLWETDVQVTRDGHLILFHDDHLLRTTNARNIFPEHDTFELNDFDLEQIQMLDPGAAFIENDPFGEISACNITQNSLDSFKREKIPTLEEALLYTQNKQWPVNLELKEQIGMLKYFSITKRVVAIIRDMKIDPALVIISSFNHGWLKEI
ncbi:MAG: glycerophosphodiester phosphodiesterase, partial [Desulfamplus sp.]|nr:glycerophosphodiester phosphodiesterase [Desulfamplus sp.]